MAELALETQGLGKCYRRYGGAARKAAELASFGLSLGHTKFWALRGVDLALQGGAALGLVGRNGAGKSTLLRLLAGTSAPSEGRLRLRGPVASLLELGAGFHLDLTGRENIQLAGLLLGLSPASMREKEGAIAEFSELGEFLDQPVRTYSSGMGMRLGFSIAASVEPRVLLIDEVFAVGDQAFQKKCVDRVLDFRRRGTTLVLCSHSLYDVRQICDQAAWIDAGKVRALGDAVLVTNDYATFARETERAAAHESKSADAQAPRVIEARVVDARGAPIESVESGEDIAVVVEWRQGDPARNLALGIGFTRQDRTLAAALGTHLDGVELRGGGGRVVLELPRLALLAGQFDVALWLFDAHGVHRYEEFVLQKRLTVRSRTKEVGLVRLEHRWRVEPGAR
ncbi:MAG TPA: ABC transporter ATP-binding protein [Planctomycetota bacterium]|nr:ABC transporter ATP-binding protein [Planctomycetota bacterium]